MAGRVAIVSEELEGFARSGGIGTAMVGLARLLASSGYTIDLFFIPSQFPDPQQSERLRQRFLALSIKLTIIDPEDYTHHGVTCERRSYSVYCSLAASRDRYDVIHFHDYKGLGFHCLASKRQGLHFAFTTLVVQVHGPTRWTIEANKSLFSNSDQLRIDFMERQCIASADVLVTPSSYMLRWLSDNRFLVPNADRVHTIKNLLTNPAVEATQRDEGAPTHPSDEIILFARHEDRKGFVQFCDAIDLIQGLVQAHNVTVTFLGSLGFIDGTPSSIVLTNRTKNWKFPVKVLFNLNRSDAVEYIGRNPFCTVVVPSIVENLPYTLAEAIALGRPVIASTEGGARELLKDCLHAALLCHIDKLALSEKVREAIRVGLPPAELAESNREVERQWLALHAGAAVPGPVAPACGADSLPKVVFGITHYERPQKLADAVLSAVRQTYENIEIVVVDDGSATLSTVDALRPIETFLKKTGGRLLRQSNLYLGAARNTIARESKSDYLLFLDDDDLAFPSLVETLVNVARVTNADIVGCLNVYMDESRRPEAVSRPESFPEKPSYIPLGGPLSVCATENWLGSATALIKRSAFEMVAGYTEMRDVGSEDFEFYFRCAQSGLKIEIVSLPLYLYEVGRPSMVSSTSTMRNRKRVIDCVDLSKNTEHWTDFFSLGAGIKAMEEEREKVRWRLSSFVSESSLHRLFHAEEDLAAHLQAVAEYAAAIGATSSLRIWDADDGSMRATLESLSGERPARWPLRSGQFDTGSLRPRPSRRHAALALDVTFNLRLHRYDEAARLIARAIENAQLIDPELATILRMFSLEAPLGLTSEPAFDLLRVSLESLVEVEASTRAGISLVLMAHALDIRHVVKTLTGSLFMLDESDYLQSHPDVSLAVVDLEQAGSGLAHFRDHGIAESRKGFVRLTALCKDLNIKHGLALSPWSVGYYLGLEGIITPPSLDPAMRVLPSMIAASDRKVV